MGENVSPTQYSLKVQNFLDDIQLGRIALPGLQRPFVWDDSQVRNLLDSMFRGFPIGYIMLWRTPDEYNSSVEIGGSTKKFEPTQLIIDGQQRLTALLTALCGEKVRDENYKERTVQISFRPTRGEFAVRPTKKKLSAEWIENIADVFKANRDGDLYKFRRKYCNDLSENFQKNGKILTDEKLEIIEKNITALVNLMNYDLYALSISNKVDEESVAEIFVRVNSEGQKLTEKNFIEPLLSVYDAEVRIQIEKFCEDSRTPAQNTAYNRHIEVEPSHLIRMAIALGMKRAKLKEAYRLLLGKNRDGETSKEIREENLQKFKTALNKVTDLNNWPKFLNLYSKAGYLDKSLISSNNAVIFSYVLYLLGKDEYKVPTKSLDNIIRRWIFMSTITSFYSGSTESEVEKQFADLRNIHTAKDYINYLTKVIDSRFTDDYFKVTLPKSLETLITSPVWNSFIASLVVLGSPQLFSTSKTPISSLMITGVNGSKKTLDRHHIFPKQYLISKGVKETREQNQVANFILLDYSTNILISDTSPGIYGKEARTKLGEQEYKDSCDLNAIPYNFYEMSYSEFLEERRKLMAQTIWKAYQVLCK